MTDAARIDSAPASALCWASATCCGPMRVSACARGRGAARRIHASRDGRAARRRHAGADLLEPVVSHAAVLVFDAIDFGLEPGTLRVLRDRDVPAWAGTKMSLHQQSFQELLAVADLQGRFPPKLTLIGVQARAACRLRRQPERKRQGTPAAGDRTGRARTGPDGLSVASARRGFAGATSIPRRWRCPRTNPAAPPRGEACRIGDARFLNRRHELEVALMCIGVPMRIESGDGIVAVAVSEGADGTIERHTLDMMIVGQQPPQTWVLAFHGAARRVLEPLEARQINDCTGGAGHRA